MYVYAVKQSVRHDHTVDVHQSVTVGENQSVTPEQTVEENQSVTLEQTVDGNQSVAVEENQSVTVASTCQAKPTSMGLKFLNCVMALATHTTWQYTKARVIEF